MNRLDLAAQFLGLRPPEMLFILAIILLVFGARRIPEMAKGVADGIKTFKKSMKDDDTKDVTTSPEPRNSK